MIASKPMRTPIRSGEAGDPGAGEFRAFFPLSTDGGERNSLMYCWVKRKRSLTSDLSHFPLTKSTLDTGTKYFLASDLTSFDIS
jgi:hypothetical protein